MDEETAEQDCNCRPHGALNHRVETRSVWCVWENERGFLFDKSIVKLTLNLFCCIQKRKLEDEESVAVDGETDSEYCTKDTVPML